MICALMLVALAAPVAAAPSATVAASKTSVNRDDTVTVTVSLPSTEVKKGGVEVSFDSKVFDLTGGKWLLSNTFMAEFSTAKKDGVFTYTSNTAVSGKIFEFTLKVKSGAALGKSNVAVTVKLDGGEEKKTVSITVACKHKYDNGCDTTCNTCGEKRTISHSWDSGKVEKKVTCTQNGTKTFACKVCGEKKTETQKAYGHDYDNACDTDCNNCGQERSTTHKYETKWTKDRTQHWYACSVCGDKKDAADHTPGPEATETEPQTCTVCGYVIKQSLNHVHTLSEEWTTDEKGHWHTCKDCDEIPDYVDHDFENECDTQCETCGFTRETEHVYQTQWTSDADGHWHECGFCGDKLEAEPHVPGPEATEFEAQICTVCGFELTPALHVHEYAWNSDGENHWHQCECGDMVDQEPHIWDNGTVTLEPTAKEAGAMEHKCLLCGANKTVEIPPQAKTVEVPLWVLIASGTGAVLLCALCMVLGVMIGKKQERKYSNY